LTSEHDALLSALALGSRGLGWWHCFVDVFVVEERVPAAGFFEFTNCCDVVTRDLFRLCRHVACVLLLPDGWSGALSSIVSALPSSFSIAAMVTSILEEFAVGILAILLLILFVGVPVGGAFWCHRVCVQPPRDDAEKRTQRSALLHCGALAAIVGASLYAYLLPWGIYNDAAASLLLFFVYIVCTLLFLLFLLPCWPRSVRLVAPFAVMMLAASVTLAVTVGMESDSSIMGKVERIAPLLDEYRAQHHVFPSELIQLGADRLAAAQLTLPPRVHYFQFHGDSYSFYMGSGWFSEWKYTSDTRRWIMHSW